MSLYKKMNFGKVGSFSFKVKVQARPKFFETGISTYFLAHITKDVAYQGTEPGIWLRMKAGIFWEMVACFYKSLQHHFRIRYET
jgi:hypothetical protein